MRCHAKHRNRGWGDLGKLSTVQACRDTCAQLPDCKFFSMRPKLSEVECTSFAACDETQEMEDFTTWGKVGDETEGEDNGEESTESEDETEETIGHESGDEDDTEEITDNEADVVR